MKYIFFDFIKFRVRYQDKKKKQFIRIFKLTTDINQMKRRIHMVINTTKAIYLKHRYV